MAARTEISFLTRNLITNFRTYTAQPCVHRTKFDSFLNEHDLQNIEFIDSAWPGNTENSDATLKPNYPSQAVPSFQDNVAGFSSITANPIELNENDAGNFNQRRCSSSSAQGHNSGGGCEATIREHLLVHNIIRAFQVRGHFVAKVDPLGIVAPDSSSLLAKYKIDEHNLDKVFTLPPNVFIGGEEEKLTLREIIARLQETYCKYIGAEYMYIPDTDQCNWLRQQLETPGSCQLNTREKTLILNRLIESAGLELFCAKMWPSEKRFGLEGCEMMIPALKTIVDRSSELGVENFIIGMPHRGRLNVLVNVCRRPLNEILTQFRTLEVEDHGCGDVKYHLGTYIERLNHATGKSMRMALLANPSHLEVVGPVVLGRTKAEQFFRGDCDGSKTLSIVLHGDSAFCGQGVVYESINLSGLPGYFSHGTIHVVVNNQIGFTTDPRYCRSMPYCTDVAKISNIPIFHVNADAPESVIHVSKIAAEWRAVFHKDAVLDLVCYRRNGHNEVDDPMFTQPLMYKNIRSIPPILDKYSKKLISEGLVKESQFKDSKANYEKFCQNEYAKAQKETKTHWRDWIDSPWTAFFHSKRDTKVNATGVTEKTISRILKIFSSVPHNRPQDFIIHKALDQILQARREKMINKVIDWSMGEAAAFGSLLKEGIHVRLTGQDVERGTFSHRHHVIHHQTVDKATYNPLKHIYPDQAEYFICNSSLTECGILAFELGYSMTHPKSLVMFEAQFGDFMNGAQSIIDTFICSGEAKWARQSGLVMLLPHGLEGAGPEHSSARVERFLQLSSDDPDTCPTESDCPEDYESKQLENINWIVANCTTPANYFHILRRQIALPFRKPLVIFTPKSLLKNPQVTSSFDEILEGTRFQRLIPDHGPACQNPQDVKKVLFCSGKVYYLLKKTLKEKNMESQIAVVRIEQLTPFPYDLVKKEMCKFSNAEFVWCQEEHKNQGAWNYVYPRFQTAISRTKPVTYVGRRVSESSAAGTKALHQKELAQLLEDALKLDGDCKQ